ncbi:hypothetical protein KGM_201611 [Danaus plexippus plexippus]|uniref:Uncharacterized protein n=1 Tax=Danaus plexippus plexippus TaxID=278856 RepID=A0A212EWF0_DANPL|nr:hypothetical protein KGM_201611 [Danaus plexippus plexippus]
MTSAERGRAQPSSPERLTARHSSVTTRHTSMYLHRCTWLYCNQNYGIDSFRCINRLYLFLVSDYRLSRPCHRTYFGRRQPHVWFAVYLLESLTRLTHIP